MTVQHVLDEQAAAGAAQAAQLEVEQLRQALGSRTTIAAAVGMVMERYGLDYDTAFGYLARLSQERNIKLRHLAERITRRVEDPT